MAEYIDKQKYREEWLKFKTFEPMKCLDFIPIADVVERKKLVEAIRDIGVFIGGYANDKTIDYQVLVELWFKIAKLEDL